MLETGIIEIKDLVEDNAFLSFEQLVIKYGNCIERLNYYSLISAVPSSWKIILGIEEPEANIEYITKYEIITEKEKSSKIVHESLITHCKLVANKLEIIKNRVKPSCTYEDLLEANANLY